MIGFMKHQRGASPDIAPQAWRETLQICGGHRFLSLLNLEFGLIYTQWPTLLVKFEEAEVWGI